MFPRSIVSGVAPSPNSGARLVAPDGRPLPLESTELLVDAAGGLARSVLRQRFRNAGSEPLEVTYLVPLPADGAVSGYSFELCGVTTRGVVKPAQVAREAYEEALLEGRSAALLEEERSSLFRQRLGNLPPGEQIEITISIDQPLAWVSGGWELRFPTVVAPRYQHASDEQASSTVPVADSAHSVTARHALTLRIAERLTETPSSPSHRLQVASLEETTEVRLVGAELDRDVVVRWGVAETTPGARLETARAPEQDPRAQSAFGLLTLVPPRVPGRAVRRDLIVLIDTSGSMEGEPLAQAVRLTSALVESLGPNDQLELIEFSSTARRFKPRAVPGTPEHRAAALKWLYALRASGGTEMKSGIDAALASLRGDALRQVVLVTDGLIGFEQEILETLLQRLPRNCRFHTVGIGHGVNRSLLQPAARAGRGAEIILAPGEDMAPGCARLLERTAQPLVIDLRFSGSALQAPPVRPLDLYAGSPALVPLELRPEGGTLLVAGETAEGPYRQELQVPPTAPGTGAARVLTLFARERAQCIELERGAGALTPKTADHLLEQLGVDFQISTRVTSWVAVSDQVVVDPRGGTRSVEQPHVLPAGMSAEGLGLRRGFLLAGAPGAPAFAAAAPALGAPLMSTPSASPPRRMSAPSAVAAKQPRGRGLFDRLLGGLFGGGSDDDSEEPAMAEAPPSDLETLYVSGLIRILNERRLAISFTLSQPLEWSLPTSVVAQMSDGSRVELSVDPKLSTANGSLTPGQELRLVMTLSTPLPSDPETLILPATDWFGSVVVQLSR